MRRRRCRPQRGSAGDRGLVLVAVIWLSGLLAAFAISVAVSVRSHVLFTRNDMAIVLARGIADGMARLTALDTLDVRRAPAADGRWSACRWEDEAMVWVAVQDQSGLVDLNTASPALMLALLAGLGLSRTEADEISAALRDYRDADPDADLGAAEAAAYAGRDFGPKNAPFDAVEELDQIPGLPPDLLAELRQLTTVHNRQSGIHFAAAPERLLQRLSLTRTSAAGLAFAAPAASAVRQVTVAVELDDGTRFLRRALVEQLDQPQRPVSVLAWDTGPWPHLPPAEPGAGSCLAGHG